MPLKVPKNAWFALREVNKNILQLFFQLRGMRKCSQQWLFSREKLIELSVTSTFLLGSSWKLKKKSMDGRWLNEGLGGGYLDQTYSSWMPKAWIRKCSFNVRCVCRSSNWWCRESIVGSKNRHPGNSSWLYLKVPTHGCLSKQTTQSHLTKILGELHFKKLSLMQAKTPISKFQHQHGSKWLIGWKKPSTI